MDNLAERLRTSPLFRSLSPQDRLALAAVARLRTYGRGEAIFAEGDLSDTFFSVTGGRVKVVKTLPNGRQVLLETFQAGDPFGAVAVYENRPFPASAVAMDMISLSIDRGSRVRQIALR